MKIFDSALLRFILVGCVNALIGSSIMFILYNFTNCNYWVSSAANYFFGSILSFFLNKYFTFKAKQWSARMIASFSLTIVLSYLVSYSAAKPLMYTLMDNYDQKIRDNVSMLVGMCLFTGLNYIGQRFVAFKKGEKNENY